MYIVSVFEKTLCYYCISFIGIAHRLHLTVCNSLGLWIRKKKESSSYSDTTTSAVASDSDDSDEDDFTDDENVTSAFLSDRTSVPGSDGSQQLSDADDETMSDDLVDDDPAVTNESTTENEFDDPYMDTVDNWSQDVLVDFDPSTCTAEQASIGVLMKKCRSFVKLVNKSSILKGYVNALKKEFTVKRSLQLDCKSRWNSSHRLLETMLAYKKLINRLNSEKYDIGLNYKQTKKLLSIELDKADWTLIESIVRVLRPIMLATNLISGRQYSTIGISFFSIIQIRESLEDERSSGPNDSNILSRLKQLVLFNMEKYFEKDEDQWNLLKVKSFCVTDSLNCVHFLHRNMLISTHLVMVPSNVLTEDGSSVNCTSYTSKSMAKHLTLQKMNWMNVH